MYILTFIVFSNLLCFSLRPYFFQSFIWLNHLFVTKFYVQGITYASKRFKSNNSLRRKPTFLYLILLCEAINFLVLHDCFIKNGLTIFYEYKPYDYSFMKRTFDQIEKFISDSIYRIDLSSLKKSEFYIVNSNK